MIMVRKTEDAPIKPGDWVLMVECPTCKSKPGYRCVGTVFHKTSHFTRLIAYNQFKRDLRRELSS